VSVLGSQPKSFIINNMTVIGKFEIRCGNAPHYAWFVKPSSL
jgi:hypothetical protein